MRVFPLLAVAAVTVSMNPVAAAEPPGGDGLGDAVVEPAEAAVPHEYLLGPDADERALPDEAVVTEELGAGWKLVTVEDDTPPIETADELADATEGTAVPNVVLELAGPAEEPLFSDQWALNNLGQSGGTHGADIGATAAWAMTQGDPSVVVAVLDSGITFSHRDLASRLWRNPGEVTGNAQDDDGNGYTDDIHGWDFVADGPTPVDTTGHGTAIAGIIAAADNGFGIAGVAPKVRIMPLRVCTNECRLSHIVAALAYAADNGADIVNMSFTGKDGDFRPIADLLTGPGSGMLAVAAAGNDGVDIDISPRYPASFDLPNLIAVAATDRNDKLAPWSNHGSKAVHLGAPGVEVQTAWLDGGHRSFSGTSAATPHVAGVAALLVSLRPDMDPAQIVAMLRTGVESRPSLEATRWQGRLSAGRSVAAAADTGDDDDEFVDTAGSVFAVDIEWLASTGITKGCNPPINDHFCPAQHITRGQFAAMMRRAMNLPDGPDVFDDDSDSVFEGDVNALAAVGIARGCNPPANDRFCPQDDVTRAEMASFLVRTFELPLAPPRFVDVAGNVHAGTIGALAASGITKGCNPPANDRYCPGDPVTRGQIAAFLRRANP